VNICAKTTLKGQKILVYILRCVVA